LAGIAYGYRLHLYNIALNAGRQTPPEPPALSWLCTYFCGYLSDDVFLEDIFNRFGGVALI
jgi:hypothetical protein